MITLLFLVCQLVHVPLYSQFSTGKTVDLNLSTTMTKLKTAPAEGSANAKSKPLLLDLPMPDGTNRAFKVADSPVMSPEMTAAYPMIKTYILQAADDLSVTGRMTVSPYGLHATILSHQGMVGIYPLDPNKPIKHVVELGISKQVQEMSGPHYCGVDEKIEAVVGTPVPPPTKSTLTNGATRRKYELAIISTGEFYNANGGSNAAVSAAITATVNSIQAIYDVELAVRFTLLTPVIYTDPATDPFIPDNGGGGNSRVQQASEAIGANFASNTYTSVTFFTLT